MGKIRSQQVEREAFDASRSSGRLWLRFYFRTPLGVTGDTCTRDLVANMHE